MNHRLIALTTGVLLTVHPSLGRSDLAKQEQQPEKEKITLVQAIRRILGLSRRVAVGGSRSSDKNSICLITPELTELDEQVLARVTVPSPLIVTAGPLNELSVLREGRVIYRKLASSTEAIETPFPWPLPPLQGGERLTLKLRPKGAAGGTAAKIPLVVASANELQRNDSALHQWKNSRKLGDFPKVIDKNFSAELLAQLLLTSSSKQMHTNTKPDVKAIMKENACARKSEQHAPTSQSEHFTSAANL